METILAIYEHGVFRPLSPVSLPEQQQVQMQIVQSDGPLITAEMMNRVAQARAARATLLAFAGCIHSGDTHSSDNDRIDDDLAREYAADQS